MNYFRLRCYVEVGGRQTSVFPSASGNLDITVDAAVELLTTVACAW